MKIDVTKLSYQDVQTALTNVPYEVMRIVHEGERVFLECKPVRGCCGLDVVVF